jgi:hypothetical protein
MAQLDAFALIAKRDGLDNPERKEHDHEGARKDGETEEDSLVDSPGL